MSAEDFCHKGIFRYGVSVYCTQLTRHQYPAIIHRVRGPSRRRKHSAFACLSMIFTMHLIYDLFLFLRGGRNSSPLTLRQRHQYEERLVAALLSAFFNPYIFCLTLPYNGAFNPDLYQGIAPHFNSGFLLAKAKGRIHCISLGSNADTITWLLSGSEVSTKNLENIFQLHPLWIELINIRIISKLEVNGITHVYLEDSITAA